MNLLETIDGARKILKDKLSSTRTFPDNSSGWFEDGEMTQWYNWAQVEVQGLLVGSHENFFVSATSINVVSGQAEYALPSDLIKIIRVEDDRDSSAPVEIYPVSFNQYDSYTLSYNRSGTTIMSSYAIKGNSLVFRPTPEFTENCAVKLHYVKSVEAYTSATSCSAIPDQYHELIMWSVVENGLIKQEATAEAMSVVLGRRNRLVEELVKGSKQRQVQHPRMVRRKKMFF